MLASWSGSRGLRAGCRRSNGRSSSSAREGTWAMTGLPPCSELRPAVRSASLQGPSSSSTGAFGRSAARAGGSGEPQLAGPGPRAFADALPPARAADPALPVGAGPAAAARNPPSSAPCCPASPGCPRRASAGVLLGSASVRERPLCRASCLHGAGSAAPALEETCNAQQPFGPARPARPRASLN